MRNLLLATMTTLVIGCGGSGGGVIRPLLDGGSKADLATAMPMPDLAMQQQPKPDLAMNNNTKTGCNGALTCINGCMDPNTIQQCITDCRNGATPAGWNKLVMLIQCIFGSQTNMIAGACPDFNGGVCDSMAGNYSQTKCDNCVSASQMPGGKCEPSLTACHNDVP